MSGTARRAGGGTDTCGVTLDDKVACWGSHYVAVPEYLSAQ